MHTFDEAVVLCRSSHWFASDWKNLFRHRVSTSRNNVSATPSSISDRDDFRARECSVHNIWQRQLSTRIHTSCNQSVYLYVLGRRSSPCCHAKIDARSGRPWKCRSVAEPGNGRACYLHPRSYMPRHRLLSHSHGYRNVHQALRYTRSPGFIHWLFRASLGVAALWIGWTKCRV